MLKPGNTLGSVAMDSPVHNSLGHVVQKVVKHFLSCCNPYFFYRPQSILVVILTNPSNVTFC